MSWNMPELAKDGSAFNGDLPSRDGPYGTTFHPLGQSSQRSRPGPHHYTIDYLLYSEGLAGTQDQHPLLCH